MFVVISFRTGPGRSEFAFFHGEDGDWFDAIWEEVEAQEVWAEMWRYTAEHYRENPIVVGYDLMDVLVRYWSRNSVRPSTMGVSPRPAQTPLD